jgi:hypothetical protein
MRKSGQTCIDAEGAMLKHLMDRVEEEDVKQLKSCQSERSE